MIYAIVGLLVLFVLLYAPGCFLMRALLKISDASDQDSWLPVLLWPGYVAVAVGEAMATKKFKW